MLKNFLLLATRNFFKNAGYSIINIFGLSIGLAAFIMLTLFVRFETSYDTFHDDHERIYRVEQMVTSVDNVTTWSQLPAPLSIELENKFAEVEEAITIREVWGEYLSTSDERTFFESNGFYANTDVFDLFTFKFIAGNKETALSGPMAIVLTESVANKLFPDSDPMGQNILVDSKRTYQVTGIIEDLPFNSYTQLTYLLPFTTYTSVYKGDFFEHWDWHDSRVYVKLHENIDENVFKNKIKYFLDEYIEHREEELELKPLWMVHLRQGSDDGYWIAVTLYGAIGIFTLILATMNFVNLTTAYSLTRAKEIGVKKVVGSSRFVLIKQFLGESLILVFISLLLAFTISEASLSLFNRIVSVPLNIEYIKDWPFTLFILGVTFLTGILSGLYPALVISRINPLLTLKNQLFESQRFKKLSMRKGLVIFQLILSILFVLTTMSVLDQFNYLKNKDLGFDKQNLLITSIKETEKVKVNEFLALRDELLKIPEVVETSVSYNAPFSSSWGRDVNWEGSQEGENLSCRFNRAYATYLNTMKIELVAGQDFSLDKAYDSTACLVNQTFVDAIGWTYEEAIGKKVWDRKHIIIGVMKDFHERSPYEKIQPYILIQHPGYLTGWKTMLFRVKENYGKETIRKVKPVLEDFFPESNFTVSPYDPNSYNKTNQIYLGMAKTFGFFSVVAIIVAVIGLFALVSFSSKRKVKEIGIRKVLGAKPSQIYGILTKEYLILILVANIIAIPLGILMGNADPSYYKPEPNNYVFLWTGFISLIITLLTISYQMIKSSLTNPVDSLRYE